MAWQHSKSVGVKRVKGKGRGVFALQAIPADCVIERVPVLVLPIEQVFGVENNPVLSQYCFLRTPTKAAIALGYGSLYNHSYEPNAGYQEEPDATMVFRALRAIKKGEEITINYNGDPEDGSPLQFTVHDKGEPGASATGVSP